MLIHRERFLLLTAALASCHSAAGRGEPVDITIAAPTLQSGEPSPDDEVPEASSSAFSARCAKLRAAAPAPDYEAGLQTTCQLAGELCEHYAEEFLPLVADGAIGCLESQPPSCDACGLHRCTLEALEGGDDREVRECDDIAPFDEHVDEYTRIMCRRYAAGMNSAGRDRFASCLSGKGYAPVAGCLWNSGPCSEGYMGPSYE